MDTRKIARLEVNQPYPDYCAPVGSVLRITTTGETIRLLRRKHRTGPLQTWWVARS